MGARCVCPPSITGWEGGSRLVTRDSALVRLELGPSGGHTAWLSTSILVPKPWSMAKPSFGSGIQSNEWSEGRRERCRNVGPESRMQG